MIGKKLPLHKTEEDEVMMLQERVAEAQRIAKTVSKLSDILSSMQRNDNLCSGKTVDEA